MTTIASLPDVQRALLQWHAEHGLRAPWRESADPYACLVAAMMAQQTQMSRVMPAFERMIAAFPTVEALAAAPAGAVLRVWAGMGYNQRAVRLHRAARRIASEGWPRDAAGLARIDGIGAFTAAIVASFAFGAQAACVDTNVRRVLGRLAGDETLGSAAMQRLADASLAGHAPARWNQALMDAGARICTPRPKCGECPAAPWCASRARYVAGPAVREKRTPYRAPKPAERYEESARFLRGRIVDALRDAPVGATLTLRELALRLDARAGRSVAPGDVRALVDALASQGVLELRGGGVGLPEEGMAPSSDVTYAAAAAKEA